MTSARIVYDLLRPEDIDRAYEIETAGFPEDEAASIDALRYRQANAGEYFLGAYETAQDAAPASASDRGQLVGYVCATLTSSPSLTHDSMAHHEPNGAYVAIHSVCVARSHLRRGIATALLREYLRRLEAPASPVRGALLIAHEEVVPLYTKAGFELVGPSPVTHGARPWFELRREFARGNAATATEAAPSAPEEDEGEVRSPGRLLGYFKGEMGELVDSATGTNKVNLYCPRAECRCCLLRAGAGKWVQETRNDFELPELPRLKSAPATTVPTPKRGYWSVSSPLAFENIGFSRNAAPPSSSSSASTAVTPTPTSSAGAAGNTIKYLTCADCDHGPLGWHDTEGRDLGLEVQAENDRRDGSGAAPVRTGREFLLAVERVRYKV
ncbi:hypothetical protein JCM8202_002492 [Rhodotorula sphaerocarpa]